jgi:hypothetical protein
VGRIQGIVLGKGIELLLAIPLWNTYGGAKSAAEVWATLAQQEELSQIGTLTCVVVIIGIFSATVGLTISGLVEFFKLKQAKKAH